jgi:signal transduction histidine kinase
MSRIGLLLPEGRNRHLIEETLAHHHHDVEIVAATGFADAPVDVLLAEPRSLLEALTGTGATARSGSPVDVGAGDRPPIVLLARAGDRPTLPATVVNAADEIVTVPAPQRELVDRITRLAARHRHAADERRLTNEHVAHISHELRTPLQCVLAFAELLHGEGLDPAQSELLDSITSGGRRMLELVNELLDRSRAEAGHRPDRATMVDLTEPVRAAIATIRPLAEQRHLTVTVHPATDPAPRVYADPVHVHRVLINLLSNATKYNREHGAIDVHVRVEPACVAVDITDTGPGITPDELERVFEPYERLPGSTAPGTGLGLPYARLLAQRMHGEVTAVSRPGKGSTFTLTLPREDL